MELLLRAWQTSCETKYNIYTLAGLHACRFTRLQDSVRKVVHVLHTACLGRRAPQTAHRSRRHTRGAVTKRCVENEKLRRVRANYSEAFEALQILDTQYVN